MARRDQQGELFNVLVPTRASDHLEQRGGTRTYEAQNKQDITVVTVTSLPYIENKDFFPIAKKEKIIFDFAGGDDDDWKVKVVNPTDPKNYVVEHIVELQSIRQFLEKLIGAGDKKNKYTLAHAIDAQWFEWWNKPLDAEKVSNRKNPDNLPDLKTINALVFQALGTNKNIEDFVMLEKEINEIKKRVWMRISTWPRSQDHQSRFPLTLNACVQAQWNLTKSGSTRWAP